jgi:CRP-like cAMP-binding protein
LLEKPKLGNNILDLIPESELDSVLPSLQKVDIAVRQSLFEAYEPIDSVYFPVDFVGSAMTVMENGSAFEIATTGREGFVGLDVFLGGRSSPTEVFAQIAGSGYRMHKDAFLQHVDRNPEFAKLLARYARSFVYTVAQSVACNHLHSLPQRCARWLLMTQDRVTAPTFRLTQDFLALMLGVNRPTVSIAASGLQRRDLITYTRGRITIVDRAGLEGASCECYRVNREKYEEIMQSDLPLAS